MEQRDGGRIGSLDGLRGIAAVIVTIHHAVLASCPSVIGTTGAAGTAPSGSLAWFLSETPLHIFWAGQEMVVVFFVLSGFVLALPAVKRGAAWFDASFYPRRMIRLYVPVLAALLLAGLLHAVVARPALPQATWWLNMHAVPITGSDIARDASLLPINGSAAFTTVLWSLRVEVLFSLLLPLMILLPLLTRNRRSVAALAVIACLLVIAAGMRSGEDTMRYLPMLEIGAILAFHLPALTLNWAWRAPALLGAVCLLTMTDWAPASVTASGFSEVGVTLGACLALSIAMRSALLCSRPARWAGSRSYSLYLVHEPIIVTLAFALGGRPGSSFLLAAVPIALLTAEAFWRTVERPSLAVARRVRPSPNPGDRQVVFNRTTARFDPDACR